MRSTGKFLASVARLGRKLAGERSPASFHHVLDGLETALKDVRRVVIPNASHSSNLDNPQAFARAVLAFLVGP